MKSLTRRDAADYLCSHDNYCILTHRRPDGDTIGSAAALCRGLRAIGKTAWVLENPEITPLYAPLLDGLTVGEPADGALLVAVDVAADNMLPKAFAHMKDSIDLRIDHHGGNRDFTPRSLVDPEAAACAEIIFDVLEDMEAELDEKTAEAIYVGTATDTGCFRYANTTVHTFDTAAECYAAGVDVYNWNQALFETNSLAKLRLQGWVAENTKLFSEGRMAICALPKAIEERIGIDEDDMGNLSAFIRTIEGVRMAALLRETEEGYTKISLRAVPGWDAAAVCEKFGGGGHAGAAGASVRKPLNEAAQDLEQAMLEWERS